MATHCDLEQALDRTAPCTEADCGLWDDGCVVAGLRSDLRARADLAALLLALRGRLELERRSSLRPMLPPGLRD